MLTAGGRLGRYHLRAALGAGGMSAVYRAYDPVIDREIALKVLPPEMARDETLRLRFQEEARALAKLDQRNLVRVYSVGQEGTLSYYAMELVQGRSLRDVLKTRGRLTTTQALAVFSQMLAGIDAIHRAGILHRDIKPGNIMLEDSGRVLLMDFGLARRQERQSMTALGAILGTPEYISPEQALGQPANMTSDLYSAGVVLFEMLTGRPPFAGADGVTLLRRHVETPPPDMATLFPDVPSPVARIAGKLLAKCSAERYSQVGEVVSALAGLAPDAVAAERIVHEMLAGSRGASEMPRRPMASVPPGLTRSELLRTWIAVTSAVVSVLALLLALAALFQDRLPALQPGTMRHAAEPVPGSRWQVTRSDGGAFTAELVRIDPDPDGGSIWTFRHSDGSEESLPDSRFTLKRLEKGGKRP